MKTIVYADWIQLIAKDGRIQSKGSGQRTYLQDLGADEEGVWEGLLTTLSDTGFSTQCFTFKDGVRTVFMRKKVDSS